jgi:IS605 OrfB family transposase
MRVALLRYRRGGQTFTYQTRIGPDPILDACAELYGRIERRLFADVQRGESCAALKSTYLVAHAIPARLFNAARIAVEGKIKSVQELQVARVESLKRRIRKARKVIARLEKQQDWPRLHQKKRRLAYLETKLAHLEADLETGKVRIAFGSKKLWRAQFDLAANGYESHGEWLADWQAARSSQWFIVGSKDETAGCQLCVATLSEPIRAQEQGIDLRVRVPDALAGRHGKYHLIGGLHFAYGHDQVAAAIENNRSESKDDWQAITYRFKRDGKGWRVFVSVAVAKPPSVTDKRLGVIGVDLNADHLAVAETDRSGNPLRAWSVPLVTYGKTTDQAEALIGDACKTIVDRAAATGKPISIERLDFSNKKAALEDESPRYARMLSSLSYNQIKQTLKARAFRLGVEVFEVNPAYSSVIGRIKYAARYGFTVHQAAALVLAQRILRVSERPPRVWCVPDGRNGQVTFPVPARNRGKHVWSFWRGVSRALKAALAVRYWPAPADPPPRPLATVL